MKKTVTLTTPVEDVDETKINQLELREPTGGDLLEVGALPFTIETTADGKDRMEFNTTAIFNLIVRLASVPPLVVRRLSGRDFVTVSMVIVGFFNAAVPETSSPAAVSLSDSSTAA